MAYAPLLKLNSVEEYRERFKDLYFKKPVTTFDGIEVIVRHADFDHIFYEDHDRDRRKDTFSWHRAERMEWIRKALEDDASTLYAGWNRDTRKLDLSRRVAVVDRNYVVIIRFRDASLKKAILVTHFEIDESGLSRMKLSPWQPPERN